MRKLVTALVFILLFVSHGSQAAGLYSLSDVVSRMSPSAPSDHTITFKTTLGFVNPGMVITINFDSGFNLSAISLADIKLTYGPYGNENALALAAVADASSWGYQISGSSLALTHPTTVAGSVPANNAMQIMIGTNAGGTSQIVNPATLGSKIIRITADNGETGALAVPIAADQIGVGGNLGAPTAVVLSSPTNITDTSMTLSWTANLDTNFASYVLYYGTAPGVTIANAAGQIVINNHLTLSTVVNGLTADTQYYFVLVVNNTDNLYTYSNEVSARTIVVSSTVVPPVPATPLVNAIICPVFRNPALVNGTMEASTVVYINNDSSGINYPTSTTWEKLMTLILGINTFSIYAINPVSGMQSAVSNFSVHLNKIGDVNSDSQVNDYDLAGLAWHWVQDWCPADFNSDKIVNDFDLAGLASHWGL